ncbi:hypothetical protein D3C78_1026320 [compost metagenome]
MKRLMVLFCLLSLLNNAIAQSHEAQQLLLNAEKLSQLKNILSDMQKGYETLSKGYNLVIDVAQGNFNLHDEFLKGLLSVSPAVKNYKKVAVIINRQKELISSYKKQLQVFTRSNYFTQAELNYLKTVYENLAEASARNLEDLLMVLTAGKLRMNEQDRLKLIDNIYSSIEEKLIFLRDFNARARLLVFQRKKEQIDLNSVQQLYLPKD